MNPYTGLHDETPTVSEVQHYNNFSYNSGASTATCETCHTASPSTRHQDGTFDSSPGAAAGHTAITFAGNVGFTDAATPTCGPSLTGCHLEQTVSESWSRLWYDDSDQTNGAECAGCHGDFSAWASGTMHNTLPTRGNSTHINSGSLGYQCTDCHVIGDSSGGYTFTLGTADWDQDSGETSNHGNGQITINIGGTTWSRSGGRSGCEACHDGPVNSGFDFPQTSWTVDQVTGDTPPVGCNNCHGNKTNGTFWPDGSTAHTANDQPGEHQKHIDILTARHSYVPTNEADQKEMCAYCHKDPNDSTFSDTHNKGSVDVGGASYSHRVWDTYSFPFTATDNWTVSSGECSNVDCHNNKATGATYAWEASATTACTMCHTPGGSGTVEPASGLHETSALLISGEAHDDNFAGGSGCTTCHTGMASETNHINGADNGNTETDLGLFATYTQTSSSGNGSGTCSGGGVSAAGCHGIDPEDAGSWVRKWDDTISYANDGTTECAGCHGGFGASDWTFGSDNAVGDNNVSHERDWDQAQSSSDGAEVIGNHSGSTQATRCNICHVYGDTEYTWGTYHRDRKITMNSTMGYSAANNDCSTNCHSEPWGNTDHNLEDASTRGDAQRVGPLAGPALSCTGCHNGGAATGAFAVGADSPHSNNTNSAGYTCEDCHFADHTSRTTDLYQGQRWC
jgi:predicted CxxxxCH...CXXCH cytochrome family protein